MLARLKAAIGRYWNEGRETQSSPITGIAGEVLHALVPRIAQIAMNTSFRMFPDSPAAKGAKPVEKPVKQQLSP